MKESVLYQIDSLYRDDFRVNGYLFGEGEKSLCVMGSLRGNEIQQVYIASQLVRELKKLEKAGKIRDGRQVLVIPSGNPSSLNIQKRFWPTDNTDINRMFPGYDRGETTQRIANGIFEAIKDYKNGIQLTSFYMSGNFMPHVRMMTTGHENVELAKDFGLPYVVLRRTRPYDTTTLNYNWQIWESNAFSLYTTMTSRIDKIGAKQGIEAILHFMYREGILTEPVDHEPAVDVKAVYDTDMITVRAGAAGLFETYVIPGEEVTEGEILARVLSPSDGEVLDEITAPAGGRIFFLYNDPLVYDKTAVIKIVV